MNGPPDKGEGSSEAGAHAHSLENYGRLSDFQDRQTVSVTDLISEGPIYGLLDGQSSVFLNDDRAAPISQATTHYSQTFAKVSLTNNSTTATITNAGSTPVMEAENGDKYLIVRAGAGTQEVTASNGSAGGDNGAITATLTTTSNVGFFTSAMISSHEAIDTQVPVSLRAGTGLNPGRGDGAQGEGILTKRVSASVAEYMPDSGIWIPNGKYILTVDSIVKIASISGSTLTLATAWTGATGSKYFDITGAIVATANEIDQTSISNYKDVTTQFRVGSLAQKPFAGEGGSGYTALSNSPSAGGTLEWAEGYANVFNEITTNSGDAEPKVLIGSASAGFNLTASQLQEVDEARITIAYPGGHYGVDEEGDTHPVFTQYRLELAIKKIGESNFESYIDLNYPLTHRGKFLDAVTKVHSIDLMQYRPFADFKVRVSRLTNHTGGGFKYQTPQTPETSPPVFGTSKEEWQNISASSITNTTCIIKEVLTHPYSAIARTTFSTKQFQGLPKRSFHLRGLKIKVPSNYVTREQSSNGVASYKRNTTTGDITSTYQDWDGEFRRDTYYTNNPAWVFYDILTNNRYGLGDFLQETDIDKYSLYRIARYCDDLVPDGKGGEEPRFTANLYFTKQADAYKMLKDVATVFRAMLYYLDGEVVPVIDAPSGPVYNFTKGNILEGRFSYEGTGSKTRINQVVVTWTNPDANYKPEPLIVEDKLNIAETGKLISQNSVAMGAISEGQAMRYGRWKLWTAANQREVVSFSTALNATFLVPGDVINVQDADRYAVRYSGRISNTGTRSTSVIPLDNAVTLNSGSTYTLSVIFVEPGAYVTEDVTVAGVDYKKGDLLKQAYFTGNSNLQDIDTKTKSLNARASFANVEALVLTWSDATRVETQAVSTSSGSQTSLTVSSAFSATPAAEAIWVLTETAEGANVLGSAKEYKVLAISQSSKNEFNISAVEYYDEKFAAVDEDFTTYIADSVYPPVRPTDIVPPVTDVFSIAGMDGTKGGEELTIQWSPPSEVGEVSGVYEHLSGYEITHEFPGYTNPFIIGGPSITSWKVTGILDGDYRVAVRAINILNNLSLPTIASITVNDKYNNKLYWLPDGVPYKGDISVSVKQLGSVFQFTNSTYQFKHPGADGAIIDNTSTTASTYQQECSGLSVITQTKQTNSGEFILAHNYLLLDSSDTTDRLKLLKYHKPEAAGTAFWFDTGTGSTTDRYGSNLTGTFTKAANSSKVTGSGTSFLTEIVAGDVLKLGSDEVRVASIQNDTLLYLARPTETAHSTTTGKIPNIRIDYTNDSIIAKIYRTSSGYHMEPYVTLDANLTAAADLITANTITASQIAADAITATEIATNAVTADAILANSITATEIDAGTITATQIAANTITATQIAADAVTATEIDVTNLAAINANLGAITAGTMRSNVTNYIPDANAAPSGTENGAFIDLTAGKFVFGDASEHILWNGSTLTISGVTITGATITGGSTDTGVQSNWNEASASASAFILNKPTIPSGNQIIDWTGSSAGNIHLTNLPATALTSVQTAANQSAMLALTTEEGDVVVRSDESKTYMHNGGSAGTMADFTLLSTPTDSVTSVDGATGVVTLNHDSLTGFVTAEHVNWAAANAGTINATNYVSPYYTSAISNASASATGLLTSTDWSTFNGKAASGHTHSSGGSNYYLDGITKDGNVLTFEVNGGTDVDYTFGSAAFTALGDYATSGHNHSSTYHALTTVGIADNNLVEIDDADAADNDFAKFTANGLEGRSYAEVKTDLSLNNVENTALSSWAGSANITTLGTISAGVWGGGIIPEAKLQNQSGTNTGDNAGVTSVATSTGITGGTITSSGTIGLNLDALTDMTETWVNGTDEFIVLDDGTQKKKLSSEIFGSNAFTSTTIPSAANNATITLAAGSGLTTGGDFTTNQSSTETITFNVGAGDLIDVQADQIDVDLSELIDMTAAVVGTQDEMVLLDNGVQRRKLISEITLSDFSNDLGYSGGNKITLDGTTFNHDDVSDTGSGPFASPAGTASPLGTNNQVTLLAGIYHIQGHITGATQATLKFDGGIVEVTNQGSVDITANSITANEIAAGTITADEITAGTITATEIAANSITATQIAADTITASQIAADAITATEIATNAITADAVAANAITATEIAADAITATQIATNAVTADAVAANAITATEIAAGTITASQIAAGTITASLIAADAITATEINGLELFSSAGNLNSVGYGDDNFNGTPGYGNSVFGHSAGENLGSSAHFNTCIGAWAGRDAVGDGSTTESYNTFVGYKSGNDVSGNYNTGIGSLALSTTIGHYNIGIGYHAGYLTTSTADNNIMIGKDALYNTTAFAFEGDDNIVIGTSTGIAMTSAFNNIIIGKNAGDTLTSGDNNIIIGNGADAASATGSNQLKLGGWIAGDSSWNITATGNITAYSDERLKSDIKTLDGKKVLEMRGVEYIRDGEKGSGVIAQELEKIAPELVQDGEYKSVAYGNITGYLIEAIKTQQQEINELKDLVKQLLEK